MSEISKVNTPSMGYENVPKTQAASIKEKNVQNVVDTTKVTRFDGKSGNAEKELGLKYESNFDSFLEILKNTPHITELLSEIFFQASGEMKASSPNGFLSELSKLLQGMNLSKEELLLFLKEQAAASGKFNSSFFQGLADILEHTKSADLQREILHFTKLYNEVSSSGSTFQNIQSILKNISSYMLTQHKQPFEALISKLSAAYKENWYGNQDNVTNILKKEILPFLGNYIKNTNNMGSVRDLITMLTLNIVKYENADAAKMETSFRRLMDFRDFKSIFPHMSVDELRRMATMETETAFSKQFAEMIRSGMNGEGGWETKAAMQTVMQAMLLNESVYMPLLHFLVPASMAGRTMFSEIWVDPNHQQKKGRDTDERAKRILIKFNIKELGFFDLIITQNKTGVDLELYYPEMLKKMESTIKKDVGKIIEKNGMTLKMFTLNISSKEKKLEEVFPKIYERINTVDVKI